MKIRQDFGLKKETDGPALRYVTASSGFELFIHTKLLYFAVNTLTHDLILELNILIFYQKMSTVGQRTFRKNAVVTEPASIN